MHLITRTEDLAEACARLGAAPFVAVDTEFMREQTFWPQLCLIQMAADGTEVLVDSLAPGLDLQPFFDLMVNEQVLKVFHSARQDIEIVHHLAGVIPHPIFDTQVAAMVCGFGEAVSYSMLVKRLLSRNLDKTSRFTDWSRRPLSERQSLMRSATLSICATSTPSSAASSTGPSAQAGSTRRWRCSPTLQPTSCIPSTPGSGSRCASRRRSRWPC